MNSHLSRRNLLAAGAASVAALGASTMAEAAPPIILPPKRRPLLLAVKLTMITQEENGKKLSLTDRLKMAGQAGFDGVDLDDAAPYTPEQARDAVRESGVFVHGAINHAHWDKRLTSAKAEERAKGLANLEHCIRVSHAAGGSGVLLVIGHANDGTPEETAERARQEMKKALPLAAALGQKILVENVWNSMFYKHGAPPEQTPEEFVKFIDSFKSPWVGMYYDIGNHWKYGQPSDWIHAFGHRCVKLDVKGFSRAQDKFVDIPDGDLPWKQVQKALSDINYNGWATAEVGGGGLERLTTIRKQMEQAFGL